MTRKTIGNRTVRVGRTLALGLVLLTLAGCGGRGGITFDYPAEEIDLQIAGRDMPTLYIETVSDLRPLEQKRGGGYFLTIDYPKQDDWLQDPTELYAEALADDLEQTHLVEMVPLRAQADYVLAADVLQMGCRFRRSVNSFLVPALIGGGVGAFFGDDVSGRAKRAGVGAALAVMAVPMPSLNSAVAEIRLTLKDNTGNILWQERCIGEMEEKVSVTATSRQDQKLLQATLPRAIKKANACLVGQLRARMIELDEE